MGWLRRGGKANRSNGPDFHGVETARQVDQLVAQGVLEAFWLLPHELGGSDVPENVVYLPRGFEPARQSFLRIAVDALGRTFRYSATPDYDGRSRVPIRIRIVATSDDPTKGSTSCNIAVWGKGLSSQ